MIPRILKEELLRKSKEAVICKILLNSLENTCARVYVLTKKTLFNLFKNRLRYRCFSLNIVKILKISFLHDTSEQPLLILQDRKICAAEVPLFVFHNLKNKTQSFICRICFCLKIKN